MINDFGVNDIKNSFRYYRKIKLGWEELFKSFLIRFMLSVNQVYKLLCDRNILQVVFIVKKKICIIVNELYSLDVNIYGGFK